MLLLRTLRGLIFLSVPSVFPWLTYLPRRTRPMHRRASCLQHVCHTRRTRGNNAHAIEPYDHVHSRGNGTGHCRWRTDPRPLRQPGHAETVRDLHLVRQHDLPAVDQDDYRAAGVLHTRRRHRPHVRRGRRRTRGREGAAVVRLRLIGVARAWPVAGERLRTGPRRSQGGRRRHLRHRRARDDAGRFRQACLPRLGGPPAGRERDPADRRVLCLLRRRLCRDRRARSLCSTASRACRTSSCASPATS